MNDDIRCPKCNSDKWGANALHNFAPIEEQFLYTCADCGEQYNPDGELLKTADYWQRDGEDELPLDKAG